MNNDVEFLKFGNDSVGSDNRRSTESKKSLNDFLSLCRRETKVDRCYYCNTPATQLCNSHSIPQFVLRKIAENGMLYTFNKIISADLGKDESGLNNSGTFHLICRKCDNEIFADYENPKNYSTQLTQKMFAQIAMKCNLKHIYKTRTQNFAYETIINTGGGPFVPYNMLEICRLNLLDHNYNYNRAKKVNLRPWSNDYYEIFRAKLDYIVPIAAQDAIGLAVDFEGNSVNKLNIMDKNYRVKNMYVCIYPMAAYSEVIVFIDERDSGRYRNFYKQLRSLDLSSQLQAIIYILFMCSEEMFVSKNISNDVLENPILREIARQSSTAKVPNKNTDTTAELNKTFSLSNMYDLPNLLSKNFALDSLVSFREE